MMTTARKLRFIGRVTASVRELRGAIPPDPVSNLSPRARACLEEIKSTRTPIEIYEMMISDESPFPELPGSGVAIKPSDDSEAVLSVMQDAYRTEIEAGARLLEMRQMITRLQEAVI